MLDGGWNGRYGGWGRDGKWDVIGIRGLGEDNVVRGIEGWDEREEEGLGRGGCNDYVMGSEVDVVVMVIGEEVVGIGGIRGSGSVVE